MQCAVLLCARATLLLVHVCDAVRCHSCARLRECVLGAEAMVSIDSRTLPMLLLRTLHASVHDRALRSYALAATFNLSLAPEVQNALDEADGMQLLQHLAESADPDTAKRISATIKQLRQHTNLARNSARRPSSAMQKLTRVASFGRRKNSGQK